jgi:hypothetical protein
MTLRLILACLALAAGIAQAATPAISAGNRHSLALKADGTERAWGDDSGGQLGLGRTLFSAEVVSVLGIGNVARVATGFDHALALMRDGSVWAWGRNDLGQLGDGTTANRSTPAPVGGIANVIAVAAGAVHSVALKSDGTVWTWGSNGFGLLGIGNTVTASSNVPVQVVDVTGPGGLPLLRLIHRHAGLSRPGPQVGRTRLWLGLVNVATI